MLWRWTIGIGTWEWSVYTRFAKKRSEFHYGVGNRCKDGRYVLFLDYDNTPLSWIDEEIRLLDKWYDLGPAFRFKTKHGVHVFFLTKCPLDLIVEMMKKTSCDRSYIDVPLSFGRKIWILRQSNKKREKIKYLGVVKGFSIRESSLAHKNYLMNVLGVPDSDFEGLSFDEEKFLTVGYYRIRDAP